ncbi:MAG: AbrB/MazE/SpoVT family DNA-binding domain-containing protein [Candidatus Bathyarchaeia archaeon]
MGVIVKLDERGRLVIPSEFRSRVGTDYVEVREEEGKLVLIPVPDPLQDLIGEVSRAKPLRDLSEAAEEEAERIVREEREENRHAYSGS